VFFWAFAVCAGVALTGSAIYLFLLGPVEQVKWRARS